jgi:hypothetical protein
VAVVRSDRLTVARSRPLADHAPLERQRLGLWAGKLDHAELTAVVLRATDRGPRYALARFALSPAAEKGNLTTTPVKVPGTLQAAATDYLLDHTRTAAWHTFLLTDGSTVPCRWSRRRRACSGGRSPPAAR